MLVAEPLNIPDPEAWGTLSVTLKYDFAKQRLRVKISDLKEAEGQAPPKKCKMILR